MVRFGLGPGPPTMNEDRLVVPGWVEPDTCCLGLGLSLVTGSPMLPISYLYIYRERAVAGCSVL
jgi:hypothetical protein